MPDTPEHELLVEGLKEAAAAIEVPKEKNLKLMKRDRYRMERICQLQEDHKSVSAICKELGISTRTYYRTTGSAEFQKVLEKYRDKVIARVETVKAITASDAIEHFQKFCLELYKDCEPVIQKLLHSEDERLQMEAVKFIRDEVKAIQGKVPTEFTEVMMASLDSLLPDTDIEQ